MSDAPKTLKMSKDERSLLLYLETRAVDHERELVCDYCGRTVAELHSMDCEGVGLIGSKLFKDEIDLFVTRAEFERRKETK